MAIPERIVRLLRPSRRPAFYLGIGAPRAGTTWLHSNLRAAAGAGLWLPPVKELRFFRGQRHPGEKAGHGGRMLRETADPEDRAFLRRWLGTPDGDPDRYMALFPDRPRIGELSPIYSLMERDEAEALARLVAPRPLRVFYLMRNPYFRDISHVVFHMHRLQDRRAPYTADEYLDFVGTEEFRRRSDYDRTLAIWSDLPRRDPATGAALPRADLAAFYYDDLEADPRAFFAAFCRRMGLACDHARVQRTKQNKSGHGIRFDVDLPAALTDHLAARARASIGAMRRVPEARRRAWIAQIDALS